MSVVAKWSPISATAEHLFVQCITNYGCDKQEGDKFKYSENSIHLEGTEYSAYLHHASLKSAQRSCR